MRFFIVCLILLHGAFHECCGMGPTFETVTADLEKFFKAGQDQAGSKFYHWYRTDKNGKDLGDEANFTDHIIKKLVEKLHKDFGDESIGYLEKIEKILRIIRGFINEKFVPYKHREAIGKIFHHALNTQGNIIPRIRDVIFDNMSKEAQTQFTQGIRVKVRDINHAKFNKSSGQFESQQGDRLKAPSTELVEILFMQLVAHAADDSDTLCDFLNKIEEIMKKFESLFGHDENFKMIQDFKGLRAKITKIENEESPLPDTIHYAISLIEGAISDTAELCAQELQKKETRDQEDYSAQEKWKKTIAAGQHKEHVSLWDVEKASGKNTQEKNRENTEDDEFSKTMKGFRSAIGSIGPGRAG